jgi:copper chaperone
MENLKFKTNIKCSSCVAKAQSYLDEVAGKDNWRIDLDNPDKLVTIFPAESLDPRQVVNAINEAGYSGELVA